jgi:cobalt-zinc-cadmium efflux system outer membrane protein
MQKGTYDLIAAKERELSAERDYAEAWKDYWIARAHLEKAIGGRLEGNADAQPSASLPAKTTEPTATHEHKP